MAFVKVVSIIIFFTLTLCVFNVNAQSKKLYKGQYHRGKSQSNISFKGISKNELITIFMTTGYATYYGDLCDGMDCFTFRPQLGGGAILRTNYLGNRLNIRTDIRFFRLYSNDIHEGRNLDFRSSNWEFILSGQIDLFSYEKMMRRRTFLNPYILLGIGMVSYDPWGSQGNDTWTQLRPLQTEQVAYGNAAFLYTGGIGFKFRYSYKWNFMVDGGYRFTTTDYLDDASQNNYPAPSSFSNPQAAWMSNKTGKTIPTGYRGDPKGFDGYFIFSAGVTYTFTKNHKPKFHGNQHLLRKH